MKYNVSFIKNNVPQTNFIETDRSPVDIGHYYRDVKKVDYVCGITIATADDERPGKPCIKLD